MPGITDPGEEYFKDGLWGWVTDQWKKLIGDDEGHLQIDVITSGLPAGGATAANQATMITALQLIDDLHNALDSVGNDELDVNVETSVLPTDAATSANQTTMITALQLIDDLHDALDSVGDDELDVNVEQTVLQATTPDLYNVTMTDATTEYSQALPANTKKFLIKCRGEYAIKVCFTSGQSGTTYITIPSGMSYWEDIIQPATLTLYFQCATAAQVAEIIAWS